MNGTESFFRIPCGKRRLQFGKATVLCEKAEETLQQIEKETRTDEKLTIPEQLGEVGVSVKRQTKERAMTWVAFGIVLAALLPVMMYARWKEERRKRNNALIGQYPSFVNRLWLLLGAGMTVQMGIRKIASEMKGDILLKKELEYAMHQLDTGSEESWVYEQLGQRLGYTRGLCNFLSKQEV